MIKNGSVKHVLFVCISIGLLVPLVNLFFIYPSLTKNILIKNVEDDAMILAENMSLMLRDQHGEMTKGSVSPEVMEKLAMLQSDHLFLKVALLSESGSIRYSIGSTGQNDTINADIFHAVTDTKRPRSVVRGQHTLSDEDEKRNVDIIQTYVPILDGSTLVGALAIEYDITRRNEVLGNILLKASVLPFILMLGGFAFTVVILFKLDGSISRQKKTEEELKVFADKLQHSNRELESFANIASHDLQEPLRKVVAFGDRLVTRCSSAFDDQGRDYLDRMQGAAKRMQILIEGLLNFSRVSTKASPFAPVDLEKVTRDVISDLEVRIQHVQGKVEVGDLPTIEADRLQMRQLMQNLIGNALKFSQKGIPPLIKVYCRRIRENGNGDALSNELYQLTVEDNGIGFEEKYAERIFDVFQRLHGRAEYEGSGIGLSICRKIVDRHNGTITAKSSPGKGASFIVILPLTQGGNNDGNGRKIDHDPNGR